MLREEDIIQFNKSKIYEKLDYQPQPQNYNSNIPWVVQQQIGATNGIHYLGNIGKLKDYPIYTLPVKKVNGGLMLDIGNGWGRWLVAGANKGYIPIGVDIRLEFCQTAKQMLKDLKKPGYSVVADLENIPFKDNVFDLVWSFSVIQHTHYKRLVNCLSHINRVLSNDGFSFLEFPNKNGIRNSRKYVKDVEPNRDNYNSWSVRYYTIKEYKDILAQFLSDVKVYNHSFIGIGVLKDDLKYVSLKNKLACLASLLLSEVVNIFPALMEYSDSVYLKSSKKKDASGQDSGAAIDSFYKRHKINWEDNLNIVPLLKCPKYGGELVVSSDRKRLISEEAGIYYPIEKDIPILIASESQSL